MNQLLSLLFFSLALVSLGMIFPVQALAQGEREITLEEAFHSALRHNTLVSASAFRIDQAKENTRIARSPMFPQVVLQGRAIRLKETPTFTSPEGQPDAFPGFPAFPDRYNEVSIQASQVLFQGGRLMSGLQASRYITDASEFEDYRTRQRILFSVSNGFYNVLFARRSTEIAESQLSRANQHLELARQRHEVGLVERTAVLRAQVQVAAAMESLEQARNNHAIAMEQLALEMGIPTPPESVKEPEEIHLENISVEAYIEIAFNNRRDLFASEKGLLAFQKQVEAERRAYLPAISMEGSYSWADDDAVYYGDNYTWQAALVFTYPLFTGLRDTAQIARAKAREAEAQASHNRIRQEIRVDARSAYADIRTRKKMVQHFTDQVEAARANHDQLSAMFAEGIVSTIDVVDAQATLNEAEQGLASVYYRLQLDKQRLRLAIGMFQHDLLN